MTTKQSYMPSLMDREYYKNKVATDPSWRPLCPSTVCAYGKARAMIKCKGGFHCTYCSHEVNNDMTPMIKQERRAKSRERKAA